MNILLGVENQSSHSQTDLHQPFRMNPNNNQNTWGRRRRRKKEFKGEEKKKLWHSLASNVLMIEGEKKRGYGWKSVKERGRSKSNFTSSINLTWLQ